MTVLLTGWSGHALASTRGGWAHPVDVPRSTRRPGGEIGDIVRRDPEGSAFDRVARRVCLQQGGGSNGATLVSMTSAAGEVASVAASHTAVIVSLGAFVSERNGGHDDAGRVRTLCSARS